MERTGTRDGTSVDFYKGIGVKLTQVLGGVIYDTILIYTKRDIYLAKIILEWFLYHVTIRTRGLDHIKDLRGRSPIGKAPVG